MAAEQTGESLQRSYPSEEHLLRLLLDGIEDYAIYVLDTTGRIVTWNTGATRLKGYTAEEAIGAHYDHFFTPEDRQAGKPQALLALAASHGHAEDAGWRVRKDGSRYWGYETYTPLHDADGALIGFANAMRDRSLERNRENRISQLNRLHLTLSEINKATVRERELPALFALVCQIAVKHGGFRLAWISLIDQHSQLPYIAASAGLESDTVRELETAMQTGDSPANTLARVLTSGEPFVVDDVLAHPEMTSWRTWAEQPGYRSTATFALKVAGLVRGAYSLCAAQPHYFDDEQVRLLDGLASDIGFAIEVSEMEQRRRQALADLSASETRYRSLIEHAPDAIFINLADKVILVNAACISLFGASDAEDLLGKSPYELFASAFHPQISERIHRLRDQGEVVETREEQIIRLDGKLVDVEVKAAPFRFGDANAIHVILHDITARKQRQAELLRLNAELEQRVAERTAELRLRNRQLETYTYSVSHDLKAPLRGIDGYSRVLEEDYSGVLDEEGRRFLRTIRRATQQMSQLIDDLLAYSRLERRTLQPSLVNPQAVVQSLLAERSEEIRQRQVEVRIAVPAVQIHVDPEGLALALRNLLDNALKFTRTVSAPAIEIGGSVDGSVCRLWVRDNGIGFEMKYQERIFEIFQRLHRAEDYTGTGVGLAIVRMAIERMGGRAWATSEPDAATTFYLETPLDQPHQGHRLAS